MIEPDPRTEVAVVVSFLERFLADRAQNATRALAEYQASFPGYESVVAREYEAAIEKSRVAVESGGGNGGEDGGEDVHEDRERADPNGSSGLEQLRHEGEVSGRYERHEEIARGGMGKILRVWDRALKRSLAMKVMVKGDGESASRQSGTQALRRFLFEAQITGQLEHPGIVPVLDLGIGSDGLVYFTMSMVQGRNLQEIIALVHEGRDGWTTTRALNVILRVCDAVAFAHSKGVIHRDLKPSNVMVGQFGETYVMDWGLARRLDDGNREDRADDGGHSPSLAATRASPLLTLAGDVIGTPAYMSPEQARGETEQVGTRSDVYAIGAMLYHLLAGIAPYAPSTGRLSSESVLPLVRQGPPAPLPSISPRVPDELVAICDKAMAREPDGRYPEVMALADDLRAFLETRVVTAYETGAWAELRKWVRRNKRFAITGALGVVALVVGLAFALIEKGRADETATSLEGERQWSLKFAFEVLEEMGTNLAELELREFPGAQGLRLRVLENTKKFYEDFLAERGSDPRIRKQTARAYGHLASIHSHLGSFDESRKAAERAVSMYEELIEEEPESVQDRVSLAEQQLRIAGIMGTVGEREAAARMMQRTSEDLDALATAHPGDVEVRHHLSQVLYSLSVMCDRMGRTEQRDAAMRRVVRLREQLVGENPEGVRFQERLAESYVAQVAFLGKTRGREVVAELEGLATKAEKLYRSLLEKESGVARYRRGLGNLYTQRAILRSRQSHDKLRFDKAYADHKRAFEIRDGLAKEFPGVPEYVSDVGASLSNMGQQYNNDGQYAKARPLFERAIEHARKALAVVPNHETYRQYLHNQLIKLAAALNGMKLHREAAALAMDMFEAEPRKGNAHFRVARLLATCMASCQKDDTLSEAQRAAQCETYATQAVAHVRKMCEIGDDNAMWLAKPGLNPIRGREDFKQIEAEVKGR